MTIELPLPSEKPSSFIIRRASASNPKDIQGISTIGSEVFTTTFAWQVPPTEMIKYCESRYSLPAVQKDLANPTHIAWVALSEKDEEILGFMIIDEASPETEEAVPPQYPSPVELQRLYIDSKHHGGGIAQALMANALEWSRQNGYRSIWLGVLPENTRAVKFYSKNGFEKIGSHEFKWAHGKIDMDDVMIKRI